MEKLLELLPVISDRDYRIIDRPSFSSLKDIVEEGANVLLPLSSKRSQAFDFGSLVDVLLTEPEEVNNKFYFENYEKPTASSLTLAESLIEDILFLDVDIKSVLKEDYILSRCKTLNLWSKYTDDKIINLTLANEQFTTYIKCTIESNGKTLITKDQYEEAKKQVDIILNHEYTKDIFKNDESVLLLYQRAVMFPFMGVNLKSKLDIIKIDFKNKTIGGIDIKTGSENPANFEISFYKYKYYLQALIYNLALLYILDQSGLVDEYKIEPFKFIYISKKDSNYPVVYTVPENILSNFLNGWRTSIGYNYVGLAEILEHYKYYANLLYSDEPIVDYKVFKNNGNLKISLL